MAMGQNVWCHIWVVIHIHKSHLFWCSLGARVLTHGHRCSITRGLNTIKSHSFSYGFPMVFLLGHQHLLLKRAIPYFRTFRCSSRTARSTARSCGLIRAWGRRLDFQRDHWENGDFLGFHSISWWYIRYIYIYIIYIYIILLHIYIYILILVGALISEKSRAYFWLVFPIDGKIKTCSKAVATAGSMDREWGIIPLTFHHPVRHGMGYTPWSTNPTFCPSAKLT